MTSRLSGRPSLPMRWINTPRSRGRGDFRLDAAIVGAQKAATTTLYELACQHPGVSGCRPKEPHHFIRDDWREGMGSYAGRFPEPEGRVTIEASTSSGFLDRAEAVSARMHEHNPRMRIIFVVREPLARIRSAYRHLRARGWGKPSLEETLASAPRLLDNTRYASCLRPFREQFGAESVLVLTFDEVTAQQGQAAAKVQRFLGLDERPVARAAANLTARPKLHHRHDANPVMRALWGVAPHAYARFLRPRSGPVHVALSDDARAGVRSALDGEIREIERWTGYDLSAWRGSSG